MTPHPYAQTNIQLYNQLIQLDWTATEICRVRSAYELIHDVFTGQFRANGKPFLAHLVGTASIVAEQGADRDLVLAGLVHAVYNQGEFGDGTHGTERWKRARVQRVVGDSAEQLVARYAEWAAGSSTIALWQQSMDSLCELDRRVLVIKLADIVEDYLDHGMSYCHKQYVRREDEASFRQLLVQAAEALGYGALGTRIVQVMRASEDFTPLPGLDTQHDVSYTAALRTQRVRPSVPLRQIVRRWRQRLASSSAAGSE